MLEKIVDMLTLLIAAIQDHANALRDHSAALRGADASPGVDTPAATTTVKAARGSRKDKSAPEAPAAPAAPDASQPSTPVATAPSAVTASPAPAPTAPAPAAPAAPSAPSAPVAPGSVMTANDLNKALVGHMTRLGKGRAPIDAVLAEMGVRGLSDPKLTPALYPDLLKRVEALQP